MRKSAYKKLVILDYCGTLSMGAPDFGRRENLMWALQESGLSRFGVTDVETFWQKIASPTWEEGSRTSVGYANLIAQSLRALSPARNGNDSEIQEAACRFVAMYMDHSPIDSAWRPLLEKLHADRDVIVVIATDHYAEATEMILSSLKRWGINAVKTNLSLSEKAKIEPVATEFSPFFVANSADLGCLKMEPCFWEGMKAGLPDGSLQNIVLVDDFGFNEASEDPYGESSKVSDRRLKTEALIRDVFQSAIKVIPFFLNKGEKDDKDAQIRKVTGMI
jgi:hypothetical protein